MLVYDISIRCPRSHFARPKNDLQRTGIFNSQPGPRGGHVSTFRTTTTTTTERKGVIWSLSLIDLGRPHSSADMPSVPGGLSPLKGLITARCKS